jgi:hypothetical protein
MPESRNVRGWSDDEFLTWYGALEKRHLANLTFQEVRRAVQALSSAYVERRKAGGIDNALKGAGKRAAFALFYAPLHFLIVREAVRTTGAADSGLKNLVDLGCGTGASGAAWALEMPSPPRVTGIERNSWAAAEARWTYRTLGLEATLRNVDIARFSLPGPGAGILSAFTANELDEDSRSNLLAALLNAADRGAAVLVVEPIARKLTPWWDHWTNAFEARRGVGMDCRFEAWLPDSLRLMDRAAGLNHNILTGRVLWLPGQL